MLARAIAGQISVEEEISNRDNNNNARPGREANSARLHLSVRRSNGHHNKVAHREAARPSNRVEETGTALRKTGETGIPVIIKTNGEIHHRAKSNLIINHEGMSV